MNFENLSPELKQRAKDCQSPEEIVALAKEEGYELSLDELSAVSGGDWDCWSVCADYVNDDPCPGRCPALGTH
ncbi:MAG: Nif11-like leader peptide family natural product precursor [Atopobiaceae bacterium]|jgi:hypothetical protein|nr:Nif11-like leader peptide family natural product precursor [Atopobiaceae bacterium]